MTVKLLKKIKSERSTCHSRLIDDNKKFRSFKSKENIHKKEVGLYHGFDQ